MTGSDPTKPPSEEPRLRAQPVPTPFHVVLVEPEIPPNTGNVARLCAATGARLHLVHPLGFRVDEKSVRRAGLDYWPLVDVREHADFASLDSERPPTARRWFFSGKAHRSFLDVPFQLGDWLVFGKESVGLDLARVGAQADELVAIPTLGPVRSLNLANAVALGLYEALRQTGCLSKLVT